MKKEVEVKNDTKTEVLELHHPEFPLRVHSHFTRDESSGEWRKTSETLFDQTVWTSRRMIDLDFYEDGKTIRRRRYWTKEYSQDFRDRWDSDPDVDLKEDVFFRLEEDDEVEILSSDFYWRKDGSLIEGDMKIDFSITPKGNRFVPKHGCSSVYWYEEKMDYPQLRELWNNVFGRLQLDEKVFDPFLNEVLREGGYQEGEVTDEWGSDVT